MRLLTLQLCASSLGTHLLSLYAMCFYTFCHVFYDWRERASEWVRWQDGVWKICPFVLCPHKGALCVSILLYTFLQMIHKIAFQNFTRVSERKIDARWKKKLVHYLYESWRGKFLLSFPFFDIVAYVWTAARREKTCE